MSWTPDNPGPAFTERVYSFDSLSWSECVLIRRTRLGWTKDDLAQATGLTRQTLWRIEFGHTEPSRKSRRLIDGALDGAELEQQLVTVTCERV